MSRLLENECIVLTVRSSNGGYGGVHDAGIVVVEDVGGANTAVSLITKLKAVIVAVDIVHGTDEGSASKTAATVYFVASIVRVKVARTVIARTWRLCS